jgi:hypothetical protein
MVRWPAAFGTRFLVVVDVEEEFDWTAPFDRLHRATTAMRALPAAHRRLRAAGVSPAYMVDYPIAADPAAVAILRDATVDGLSAIGTQLHSWVTPPHDEIVSLANSFQGNLPRALEAAKLDRLTDAVTAAFGGPPQAFRAGRYGIGPASRALLADRGYRVDLSVRARYDYSAQGGPDFSDLGNDAYRTDGLVEIPSSTIFTGVLRCWGASLHPLLAKVSRGAAVASKSRLLSRVALTPEGMSERDVLAAIDIAAASGERLLVLSFHSPSLEPGHTPYVRDAQDLAAFWRWWDVVLARLARHGIVHASLAEVIAAAGA